ncbi:MAG: hypothetical protein NZ845_02240 [Thermodesulfovibrio sp.]|nr:hypothetical protein [Thermodesulfovibrio sp.]MCX7724332.1 hypothetical protein [Thermodesulfovibrio sp.]MDW7973052.1 hypothetical protein [Thermodesulfovibrio sp.]
MKKAEIIFSRVSKEPPVIALIKVLYGFSFAYIVGISTIVAECCLCSRLYDINERKPKITLIIIEDKDSTRSTKFI